MRFIPTHVHGMMDYLTGVILIAVPWLFGFASISFVPHLVVDLFEVGAGLTTRGRPSYLPAAAVRT